MFSHLQFFYMIPLIIAAANILLTESGDVKTMDAFFKDLIRCISVDIDVQCLETAMYSVKDLDCSICIEPFKEDIIVTRCLALVFFIAPVYIRKYA
ncbi:hypothetical protein V2J09_003812 [Rumex salicifolius]